MHTVRVETKLLLSVLFIKRSPESEEGGGDKQMTPQPLNEAFSVKTT